MTEKTELTEMAVDIVVAYVGNNNVAVDELPGVITNIYNALASADAQADAPPPPGKPAVSPRRSVTSEYIICLEDGEKFKSLKRHLSSKYNMTPDEYRAKWGLASDYPMVAPSYSATRSKLAKKSGLGYVRKKSR